MAIVLKIVRSREFLARPTAAIKAKYENVLAGYVSVIEEEMKSQIIMNKWEVPFKSARWGSGEFVEVPAGPRDIVDSGNLLTSFYSRMSKGGVNGSSFTLGNSAKYVSAIRNGYMTVRSRFQPPQYTRGTKRVRKMPARDFVAAAFRAVPFKQYLAENKAQKANVNFGGSTGLRAPSRFT
jgi:hypothetical protein